MSAELDDISALHVRFQDNVLPETKARIHVADWVVPSDTGFNMNCLDVKDGTDLLFF